MASKAKKPRKLNGYKMPAPIPAGFVVKNSQKQAWTVGSSIGKGGFGEIYCCAPLSESASAKPTKSKGLSYPFAMKIEPQENGPLFIEMHFYMKVAKKEDMENWMKSKGIKRLGMPSLEGSGSFEYNNERYRFIVIDRYGQDIWSLFLQNNKLFPCSTVLQLGLQIIDVFEYIHDQGYAHCDLKGTNLLLGTQKGTENQVYLVDFGLASRYSTTEFKPDPKKAHNGTIEYTSRDAHQGVITRRGDMEILGFNLLHWATSSLPWENVTDPAQAEQKKKSLMEKISTSAKKLVPTAPSVIVKYLEYVNKLKHDQAPDYEFCRKLFKDELKKIGEPKTGKLVFKVDNKTPKKTLEKTSVRSRKLASTSNRSTAKSKENEDSSEEEESPPTPKRSAKKKTVEKTSVQSRKRTINHNKAESQENEDSSVEEECPPTPKRLAKKPKEKGPSWRDCETAKTSGVIKAGEYVSTNPKSVKRQNKH